MHIRAKFQNHFQTRVSIYKELFTQQGKQCETVVLCKFQISIDVRADSSMRIAHESKQKET